MPVFVMMTKLTDEGRKTLKKNPERIHEVNEEIQKMGIRILNQYAILGDYDFVNILEAKDNNAITKLSVEMGSRGTVQPLTFPAIAVDEFIQMLKD